MLAYTQELMQGINWLWPNLPDTTFVILSVMVQLHWELVSQATSTNDNKR